MHWRIQVVHPNLFTFLGHLQRITVDTDAEVGRLSRGMLIRRAKKREIWQTTHGSKPACIALITAGIRESNFHSAGVLAFHNCLVPHFPPLQFGADNSSLAFSVAPFRLTRMNCCLLARKKISFAVARSLAPFLARYRSLSLSLPGSRSIVLSRVNRPNWCLSSMQICRHCNKSLKNTLGVMEVKSPGRFLPGICHAAVMGRLFTHRGGA